MENGFQSLEGFLVLFICLRFMAECCWENISKTVLLAERDDCVNVHSVESFHERFCGCALSRFCRVGHVGRLVSIESILAVHPILVRLSFFIHAGSRCCVDGKSCSPVPVHKSDEKKVKTLKDAIDSGLAGPQFRGRRTLLNGSESDWEWRLV